LSIPFLILVTENPEPVNPPLAVAVPDQELKAGSATAVTTPAALFRLALMIHILANPVVPPHAPPNDISVVMVSHETL
jgi:hypothetical protein